MKHSKKLEERLMTNKRRIQPVRRTMVQITHGLEVNLYDF